MTLSELIEQLEAIAEDHADDDPEVIVAYQPTWPMEVAITRIVEVNPLADFEEEYGPEPEDGDPAWHDAREAEAARPKSVIIGTAWGNEYLRSGGSAALGWR